MFLAKLTKQTPMATTSTILRRLAIWSIRKITPPPTVIAIIKDIMDEKCNNLRKLQINTPREIKNMLNMKIFWGEVKKTRNAHSIRLATLKIKMPVIGGSLICLVIFALSCFLLVVVWVCGNCIDINYHYCRICHSWISGQQKKWHLSRVNWNCKDAPKRFFFRSSGVTRKFGKK